jgi:hypothetical protein
MALNSWPSVTGTFCPVRGCSAVVGIIIGPWLYSCRSGGI